MNYLIVGEGDEREITKEEYEHLLDELIQYRLARYFRELAR